MGQAQSNEYLLVAGAYAEAVDLLSARKQLYSLALMAVVPSRLIVARMQTIGQSVAVATQRLPRVDGSADQPKLA